MSVTETRDDLVQIGPGVWVLADGRTVRGGWENPPPADPKRRLQKIRLYHDTKLKQAEKDAKQLDTAMRGHAEPWKWPEHLYGPPLATPQAAMAYLQGVIARERAAVEELDKQIGQMLFV